jgi:antitoxin VapB
MAFHVRDAATDSAVRKLARLTGKSLTETIREAVEREYASVSTIPPLAERLQALQADFQAMKQAGGQAADKAFFDELSGHS